ncbi:MAG: hypothetical protein WAW06_02095 [bacterium]
MSKARATTPGLTALAMLAALAIVPACLPAAVTAAPADRSAPDTEEGAPLSPAELAAYLQRQTDGNALGLVLTNYGFFGNNLVTRSPSMEYPLGSQVEHLVRASLWVGAINADGVPVVSTGCVSGTWGGGSASATEFNPTDKIRERSTLITSRAYSRKAVSEQDFLSSYRDYGPIKPSNRGKALTVSVSQTSYLWSYGFAEAFVIVSFTIKNQGEGILRDLCLGIYAELLSGWKGAYNTWLPPSGSWFRKKMLEYFPDQRMVGEHHYTYQAGTAPSWGAFALLGTRGQGVPPINEVPVTFNWWNWDEERGDPDKYTDEYRLRLLKTSLSPDVSEIRPEESDPVELVSAGPFPEMVSGDSIVFVCAFLGGMDRASLIENVKWAQRAFDNSYVLPAPPQPARFKVIPTSGSIDLYWDDSPESTLDPFYKVPDFEGYRVYITRQEGATSDDFKLVRDVDIIDTLGYDTGFDDIREANLIDTTLYSYHLTIPSLKDGFRYWVSLTSYDKGMPDQGVESMQSGVLATRVLAIPGPGAGAAEKVHVFPNPYRGEAAWDGTRDREKYIWFVNLPGRATIRVFTLAGDLVKTIDFDASTYKGEDVQGLKTGTERTVELSGGICAWDLISDRDQAVATGLYIFSVDDWETGESQVGKMMVIR